MFKHQKFIRTDLRLYKVVIVVNTAVDPLDETNYKATVIIRNENNQVLDTFKKSVRIKDYISGRSDTLTYVATQCLMEYEDWDTEECFDE